MKASLALEYARHSKPKAASAGYGPSVASPWNSNGFRIAIDGLEKDCENVTTVAPLKRSHGVKLELSGNEGIPGKSRTNTDLSNIVITLPESNAKGFLDWHNDFVMNGNSNDERNGRIEYFGPSNNSYFIVELKNLGILKVQTPSVFPGNSNRPVAIEMYCESMNISAGNAAIK
jgi:hypothetical protein